MDKTSPTIYDTLVLEDKVNLLSRISRGFIKRGTFHIRLKDLEADWDLDPDNIDLGFGSTKDLVDWIVEQTVQLHIDVALNKVIHIPEPSKRFIQFIVQSIEYFSSHPTHAQIVVLAAYSNDVEVSTKLIASYQQGLMPVMRTLRDAQVIPEITPRILDEITTSILSLLLWGHDPSLPMDYYSQVDNVKFGKSVLESLRRKYMRGRLA